MTFRDNSFVHIDAVAEAAEVRPSVIQTWAKLAGHKPADLPLSLALKIGAVAVLQRASPATRARAEHLFADLLADTRPDDEWMVVRIQGHRPEIVEPPVKIAVTGISRARAFVFDPLHFRDRLMSSTEG